MVTLAGLLRERGMHVTIETAGTVAPVLECDLMSMSPKLANSTPVGDPRDPTGAWATRHESRRINLEALRTLMASSLDYQLKFVVGSPADLPEIEQLLAAIGGVDAGNVLLMPEGIRPASPGQHVWVAEACVLRGWRYCSRLHIELFGHRRGT
jgi:7-carboxy-7-deazaguanine synthase